MKKYDVYAYGMISSSSLFILKYGFPKPDYYAEIENSHKMIGGEAANSSIVLSVLGLKVKIDGNWLSDNEKGKNTERILQGFRIDTTRLKKKKSGPCPEEIVFSDEKTRTVFGNYSKFTSRVRRWNFPKRSDIINSRIVCLDPFFFKQSALVAQYANKSKIPYVTIDCQHTSEVLKNASVAIISKEFRNRFGKCNEENLFKSYSGESKGLIIFTSGNEKIMFGRRGSPIRFYTPDKIKPIDTAGAGDSFRAGVIYGALQGWPDEKMIAFSSALASLVCLSFPGVLNCPKYKEVKKFMEKKII